MANRYRPGDIFILPDDHRTLVIEVNENDWPQKIKSLQPDESLGKTGWFYEDGDWVVFYLEILRQKN